MAKRKVEIPKGSWLDQKGQRWMKVVFDVMIGSGKFLRQITMTCPVNLDLSLRNYVVDFGDASDFRGKVNLGEGEYHSILQQVWRERGQ